MWIGVLYIENKLSSEVRGGKGGFFCLRSNLRKTFSAFLLPFGCHFQNTCNIVLLYHTYIFFLVDDVNYNSSLFFFKVHCVSLNWTFGMEKGFFLLIVLWCTAFHPTHSPMSYCITPLATDDQCWQYWIIITCAKCIWFCIKCICIYWGCVQPQSLVSKLMTFRKGKWGPHMS